MHKYLYGDIMWHGKDRLLAFELRFEAWIKILQAGKVKRHSKIAQIKLPCTLMSGKKWYDFCFGSSPVLTEQIMTNLIR